MGMAMEKQPTDVAASAGRHNVDAHWVLAVHIRASTAVPGGRQSSFDLAGIIRR